MNLFLSINNLFENMQVVKRNGVIVPVEFDKITRRNNQLSKDLDIDTAALSISVIKSLVPGMTTREIDRLSSESAIFRSVMEPDYGILASRIVINDLHKSTPDRYTT